MSLIPADLTERSKAVLTPDYIAQRREELELSREISAALGFPALTRELLSLGDEVGLNDVSAQFAGTVFYNDGDPAYCFPGGPEAGFPEVCLGTWSLDLDTWPEDVDVDDGRGTPGVIEGDLLPGERSRLSIYPWEIHDWAIVAEAPPNRPDELATSTECEYRANPAADATDRISGERYKSLSIQDNSAVQVAFNEELRAQADALTSRLPIVEAFFGHDDARMLALVGNEELAEEVASLIGRSVTIATFGAVDGKC
ncbi:MAG: hypothetical protein R3A49_07860 [Acidimicrobiia bacterium]